MGVGRRVLAALRPGEPNSTDGIVTVSRDGKAVVWKVSAKKDGDSLAVTAESVGRFTSHDGPIYSVAFDPTGKSVATAGYDRRVLLWNPVDVPPFSLSDTEGRKTVKFRELDGHTAPVQSVSFSKDGALLVSGGRDNAVKVWSIEQGPVAQDPPRPQQRPFGRRSFAGRPDCRLRQPGPAGPSVGGRGL